MERVFIHIGLPRTGTTFLQRKVFPLMTDHLIDLPMSHYHPDMQRLLIQDDTLYDSSAAAKQLSEWNKPGAIISNENFGGQSLYMANTNRSRTAARLSELFPNGEVIIFLRNQLDLLRSHYAIALSANVSASPEEFIWSGRKGYTGEGDDWRKYALYNTYEATEHLEGYRYKELLDLYSRLFPKVHVFLYEDLQAEPMKVGQGLCDIMGVAMTEKIAEAFRPREKLNMSMGDTQAKLMRGVNRFHEVVEGNWPLEAVYYKSKRFIEKKMTSESEISFSDELIHEVKGYFAGFNAELDAAYPSLELKRYEEDYSYISLK